MFDTVGQNRKQNRAQQAGSMLASLAINGGFVILVLVLGSRAVEKAVEDKPVEVAFFDAAPPPPPPPPPPAGSSKPKTKPKDPEPEHEPDPEVLPGTRI